MDKVSNGLNGVDNCKSIILKTNCLMQVYFGSALIYAAIIFTMAGGVFDLMSLKSNVLNHVQTIVNLMPLTIAVLAVIGVLMSIFMRASVRLIASLSLGLGGLCIANMVYMQCVFMFEPIADTPAGPLNQYLVFNAAAFIALASIMLSGRYLNSRLKKERSDWQSETRGV
jgi:hypothetical protein